MKNKNIKKIVLLILSIIFVISAGFLYLTYNDPVRLDLKEYLSALETARNKFKAYPISREYTLKVLGVPSPEQIIRFADKYVSKGLSLREVKAKGAEDAHKYAQEILRETSIKEQYKILREYHSMMLESYRDIVPVTEQVESIHKRLLGAIDSKYKEENLIYDAIDYGKFLSMSRTPEGKIKVSYYQSKDTNKINDAIEAYNDLSDKENKMFKNELTELIKQKKLMKQYKKIFPDGIDVF